MLSSTDHKQTTSRVITCAQAIQEATAFKLADDKNVFVIGLGVPDPKAVFGTTANLQEQFGPDRVMDMPLSENALAGVVNGAAMVGMRPVMVHQRIDFTTVCLEQILNQASKWHYRRSR